MASYTWQSWSPFESDQIRITLGERKQRTSAEYNCPGLPINAIPESDKDEDSPMFQEHKHKYQSVVGSIDWLVQSTHADLAQLHFLLISLLIQTILQPLECITLCAKLHSLDCQLWYYLYSCWESSSSYLHALSSFLVHRSLWGCPSPQTITTSSTNHI